MFGVFHVCNAQRQLDGIMTIITYIQRWPYKTSFDACACASTEQSIWVCSSVHDDCNATIIYTYIWRHDDCVCVCVCFRCMNYCWMWWMINILTWSELLASYWNKLPVVGAVCVWILPSMHSMRNLRRVYCASLSHYILRSLTLSLFSLSFSWWGADLLVGIGWIRQLRLL